MRPVAAIISATLVRDRLRRTLHALDYREAPTEPPNRRTFDERLPVEILRAGLARGGLVGFSNVASGPMVN